MDSRGLYVETTVVAMERARSAAQRPMDYWCGAGPTDLVVALVEREASELDDGKGRIREEGRNRGSGQCLRESEIERERERERRKRKSARRLSHTDDDTSPDEYLTLSTLNT
ncbi:uncharacterized protein LOC143259440 isoform X2 [Megalopta genalis]|uniref:uncharacterized protein LOC143259440 isoform X2 n=1 Tax=Megalopta genalis TaxID=115081 RepID=UPI003FD08F58